MCGCGKQGAAVVDDFACSPNVIFYVLACYFAGEHEVFGDCEHFVFGFEVCIVGYVEGSAEVYEVHGFLEFFEVTVTEEDGHAVACGFEDVV